MGHSSLAISNKLQLLLEHIKPKQQEGKLFYHINLPSDNPSHVYTRSALFLSGCHLRICSAFSYLM